MNSDQLHLQDEAPKPSAWPQPASTWEEATNDRGEVIDDTLPRGLITDELSFRRWQLSLGIAVKITGESAESVGCRNIARVIFDSPVPTDEDWEIPAS